jgi:glycosyltransferase involved in cell wall biosynthesis
VISDEGLRASVIVPVLNGEATIEKMLAGLDAQAGIQRDDWEIIVVDGGSTDKTQQIVAAHKGVKLLVETRRGPGVARDTGLRAARGNIVCHLDADSMPTRRWLVSLLSVFDDSSVVLAGGKTLSLPPETPAQRYMARSGRIDGAEYVTRPVFPFVPSRNMAVRREAALAIDGWSSELITGEDVDFCHRLLAKFPSRIAYEEKAILLHRDRETSEGLAKQAWGYGEGMAHLYDRYPDETTWRTRDALHVASQVTTRAITVGVLGALKSLRIVSADSAEHAYHHWLWSWSFWRGFYSFRRAHEYRQ